MSDDFGEETNDEEEFGDLEESDTELSDEGMSRRTSISSISSIYIITQVILAF